MDSKKLMGKPKALLLKDYLLDDFSSCSSNGFKSFPRKQCCTTVRFLMDIDLKNKQPNKYPNFKKNSPVVPLLKNPSKSASSSTLSALQCVINAVKNLPFPGKSPGGQKKIKKSILPRSISKKILKKSFWKRTSHKEIERWKSIDHLVVTENSPSPPLDLSVSSVSTTDSSNDSKSSNSWSESDFTVSGDSLQCSTNEISAKPSVQKKEEEVVVVVAAATNGDVSMDSTTSSETKEKDWGNEEKEQFSPVSVIDCPFDDEDEVSSPFQHRLDKMEGTKKKLMKKIERFECLAQLGPVNLAKRFASQELDDNESVESSLQHSDEKFISDMEEEDQAVKKALELVDLMESTVPSLCLKLKAENLLLDYFRENISSKYLNSEKKGIQNKFYDEILEEARDWINGQPHELFLEWGVQKNRQAYVRDMEKEKEWKTLDEQKQEVALELEAEIYGSIINQVLLDLQL